MINDNKYPTEYHSCYDELLSKLFLMTYENAENYTSATDSGGKATVSLISKEPLLVDRVMKNNTCYYLECYDGVKPYNNAYDLTAHEILIYSLLLHKCIENGSEKQTISYEEIQLLRNKRIGKVSLLDNLTRKAYDKAFLGLCNKQIKYNLGNSRMNFKITFREYEHPLLIIENISNLCNGDRIINYSLGPFGKTLLESKRYSTLVPSKYFQVHFREIMTYQIALYVCKIIYIERRKRKDSLIITLNSVMKNVNKFMNTTEFGLVKCCTALYYSGPNTKRLRDNVIMKVIELLETLKSEMKIKEFQGNYEIIKNSPYLTRDQYKNVKWVISLNK